MQPSAQALGLIRHFEGLRLTAYADGGGVWTIGYGHTAGVKPGDRCTREQADAWLAEDVEVAARGVRTALAVPVTQAQFDALVSFAFNVGVRATQRSTLLTLLNAGQPIAAARQFGRWVKVDGMPSPGLIRRRQAEADLFSGRTVAA